MTPSQAIILYLAFLGAGMAGGLLLAHVGAWVWGAVG